LATPPPWQGELDPANRDGIYQWTKDGGVTVIADTNRTTVPGAPAVRTTLRDRSACDVM
jgi:hypothetical protein